MLRSFFLIFFLAIITVMAIAGFRGVHSTKTPIEIIPDMDRQPRYDPQHESAFFSDSRAARKPVAGTVPLGYVLPNAYYTTGGNNNAHAEAPGAFSASPGYADTGKIGDVYGDGLPLEATAELMQRGRERFTVNCAVCHGATGAGNGIVSQYGLVGIANLQDTRLRAMPDGQIFNTITNGKNTMGAYGSNVTVEDRWAIIAYLRALQRAQGSKIEDVPEDLRAQLDQPAAPEAAQK